MKNFGKQYIVLNSVIDEKLHREISNLEQLCFEYDQVHLKLELDFKLDMVKKDYVVANEFLVYDEELVGYLGIVTFDNKELEICGMVHPDYRRQGVFTALYQTVVEEACRREAKELLLVCDADSESGLSFIKHLDVTYHHAEYDMYLNKDDFFSTQNTCLNIKQAGSEKLLFAAYLNEKEIGKVRLEINESMGGIFGLEVYPAYQRQGFGRNILTWAVEQLIELGAVRLFLQVDTTNMNALHLYQSTGFTTDKVMNYYLVNQKTSEI